MTRDEAIAAAMAVYWDCEHESEPEARVAFLASLAASGFAVVPVNTEISIEFTTGDAKTYLTFSDAAWSAIVAATQEDGK